MKFEDRIQLKLSDLTEELFEKIVAYGFCAPSGMDGPGGGDYDCGGWKVLSILWIRVK